MMEIYEADELCDVCTERFLAARLAPKWYLVGCRNWCFIGEGESVKEAISESFGALDEERHKRWLQGKAHMITAVIENETLPLEEKAKLCHRILHSIPEEEDRGRVILYLGEWMK